MSPSTFIMHEHTYATALGRLAIHCKSIFAHHKVRQSRLKPFFHINWISHQYNACTRMKYHYTFLYASIVICNLVRSSSSVMLLFDFNSSCTLESISFDGLLLLSISTQSMCFLRIIVLGVGSFVT